MTSTNTAAMLVAKDSALVMQSASSVNIIYATQTDSEEIRELIRLNGGNRHIIKPVTTEKIHALAMQEHEMCLEELDGNVAEKCIGCIYHWCNNRNQNEERMT